MIELAGHRTWWSSVTSRGRYIHIVVVGPRNSGKSSFFDQLAGDGGVVRWDVRRSAIARARTTDEVWADLFAVLGISAPVGPHPIDDLEDHLDTLERGPILVIDHWDEAVDGRHSQVPDCCYEVLDELSRFCLEQAMNRPSGQACLGLALLTRLPAPSDLEYFTRDVQRPTFDRLSKLITRLFVTHPFPFLDQSDSERLLAAEGVPPALTAAVARACGGWVWLLREAAAAVREHGGWSGTAIEYVRDRRLPALLDESVLKWLAERPEVRGAPLDYLARELAAGRPPAEFGVPHVFGDPARPAPLIQQRLTRTFLVVDTENVRMPFQRLAEVEPDRYPGGVDAFLQVQVGTWLRRMSREHDVAPEDVWIVGRSQERINATVDSEIASKARHFYLSKPLADKAKRGDSSDDNLLTAQITKRAARNPMARFVLASGDADAPFVLDLIGLLDQVIVYTPWQGSTKLRHHLAGTDRLRENTFPVRRPRVVTDAELRAAREGNRRDGRPR